MKKIKTLKRFASFAFGFFAILLVFIVSFSIKLNTKFKPSFYNYKSSMSEDNIEVLSEEFDYKQFNEITEFTTAIVNNRAVAGIGTDYIAAELIKKGYLAKIDYATLFNLPDLKPEDYEEMLKVTLSTIVWDHLQEYDDYLGKDEQGQQIKLWEYFVPYFTQDAVISYNYKKVPIADENKISEDGELLKQIDFEKYKNADFLVGEDVYSIINIMKILRANGYEYWTITDAQRDNMLYGTTYDIALNNEERIQTGFTGTVNDQTYKRIIDNFSHLIKDGTGHNVTDTKYITFKGDGLEVLNDLIDPLKQNVNATLMYNGDAIDAYYSNDNFRELPEGEVFSSVRPSQNVYLVDGLVLNKANTNFQNQKYQDLLARGPYQDAGKTYLYYQKLKVENPDWDFAQLRKQAVFNVQAEYYKNWKYPELLEIAQEYNAEKDWEQEVNDLIDKINFNYLQSAKNADLTQTLYKDAVINVFAQALIEYKNLDDSTQGYSKKEKRDDLLNKINNNLELILIDNIFQNREKDDKTEIDDLVANNIAWVSLSKDEEDTENITNKIYKNYLNIDNFDYINYSLPIEADSLFVYNNYFYNGDGTNDSVAQNLFYIEQSTDSVDHKAIIPVDNELKSKIRIYYYQKTKS
ncbi:hypothetical protein [Mycoplasma sp. Ms02]|uniref:hypothetical protein n=1 Tax=Mycoplasma sp. Ms02 TaxID=353851 RepID=UPI001C891421|nr:hypothetical protein [Mycoplasma sp. Ms02]QZE12442.1 hypothetical protein K4L35_00405 [Mycoplasma sp. Ms02]